MRFPISSKNPEVAEKPPSPKDLAGRPYLAITMGDPAGIGPEIVIKALETSLVWRVCRPLVVGSRAILSKACQTLGSHLQVAPIQESLEHLNQHLFLGSHVPVLDPLPEGLGRFRRGAPSARAGAGSIAYIKTAVQLAQNQTVSGMVTGPIHKESIHLAGFPYPGHTELLADLTQTKRFGMMIVGGPLKVLFVTTHVALRDISNQLTSARINRSIHLAHKAMQEHFGIRKPRIGVAAFNPHAGEGGLFGREEQHAIAPATRQARRKGILAVGPLPADTLFGAAAKGMYDAVVAMYHDQGLIPLKLLAFGKCVNITVGLPILRTSVDHGTAFDIVGKNRADPGSMIEAIALASQLSGAD